MLLGDRVLDVEGEEIVNHPRAGGSTRSDGLPAPDEGPERGIDVAGCSLSSPVLRGGHADIT
jgi:hypothetical protein